MIQIECKKAPTKNNRSKQKSQKPPMTIIDVGGNQASYEKLIEIIEKSKEQERIEKEKNKLKEKVKKL